MRQFDECGSESLSIRSLTLGRQRSPLCDTDKYLKLIEDSSLGSGHLTNSIEHRIQAVDHIIRFCGVSSRSSKGRSS